MVDYCLEYCGGQETRWWTIAQNIVEGRRLDGGLLLRILWRAGD